MCESHISADLHRNSGNAVGVHKKVLQTAD